MDVSTLSLNDLSTMSLTDFVELPLDNDDASAVTATITVTDSVENPITGVTVECQMMLPPSDESFAYDVTTQTAVSDSNGIIQLTLLLGAYYQYWLAGSLNKVTVFVPTDAQTPLALPPILAM